MLQLTQLDTTLPSKARLEFLFRLGTFERSMEEAGSPIRRLELYRSPARQALLYAQGRSQPGDIVTNAPAGQSPHNYGLACDYIFLYRRKRTYSVPQKRKRLFTWLAHRAGLHTGSSFTNLTDPYHVELPSWHSEINQ